MQDYLLLREVAQSARTSVDSVRGWVRSARLRSGKPGRRRLIRREQLERFLARDGLAERRTRDTDRAGDRMNADFPGPYHWEVQHRGEVAVYTEQLRKFLGIPTSELTELTFFVRGRNHVAHAMTEVDQVMLLEEARSPSALRCSRR